MWHIVYKISIRDIVKVKQDYIVLSYTTMKTIT